eukprot:SAG31_NODE_486_length_15001_cov_8.454405_7_plen_66_part_00
MMECPSYAQCTLLMVNGVRITRSLSTRKWRGDDKLWLERGIILKLTVNDLLPIHKVTDAIPLDTI